MRGADASAGTIKSGGKTRRAAKMVILNATTPTSKSSSGARRSRSARRARCATPASTWTSTVATATRSSTRTRTTRCASPTRSCTRSKTTATWDLKAVTDGSTGEDAEGARPDAPDRAVGVGVRGPGHAVRHDDQPVAHRVEHGPDQRVEPVLRVHAPRQLGVQPREHQPAEVPRRRRHASTSRRSSTRSRSCSPPRRSSSATPTTRPRRSPRTAGCSVSSASATPTSVRC